MSDSPSPRVDVKAQTHQGESERTPADREAAPPDTATAPAEFTGDPSFVSHAFTVFYRSLSAAQQSLHVDLTTPIGRLISSTRPPRFITPGLRAQYSRFEGMSLWSLQPPRSTSQKVVVAVPGSAFVWPPTVLHWLNYAVMARRTGATVIVPIYPVVREGGTSGTVVPVVKDLISSQIAEHGAENVSVYGDSLGGTIALAAVQSLADRRDAVPSHMVLISPALDLSLSNPAIDSVDDPIFAGPFYSKVRRNAQRWAGDLALTDPMVSPLFGSLEGLPPTAVYFGSLEVLAPDGLVLREEALTMSGVDFTFVLRKGELHIWTVNTLLPETIAVLPDVYRQLGLDTKAAAT